MTDLMNNIDLEKVPVIRNFVIADNQWNIIYTSDITDDQPYMFIHGYIFNDVKGRFRDDTFIFTSCLMEYDWKNRLVKTRNTLYSLEKPHEKYVDYVKENPDSFVYSGFIEAGFINE